MEVTNPYAAPSAPVADAPERRYYTPGQVTLATLLGGPLAGGYLFSRNYSLFGSRKKAKIALLWSLAVSVAAIGLGFALPAHTSRTVPAAIVAGMYRWYAKEAFQGTIAEAPSARLAPVLLVASRGPVGGIPRPDDPAGRGIFDPDSADANRPFFGLGRVAFGKSERRIKVAGLVAITILGRLKL